MIPAHMIYSLLLPSCFILISIVVLPILIRAIYFSVLDFEVNPDELVQFQY